MVSWTDLLANEMTPRSPQKTVIFYPLQLWSLHTAYTNDVLQIPQNSQQKELVQSLLIFLIYLWYPMC